MSNKLNATCSICGNQYHVCSTCKNTKIIKPWRTITDTVDCYKIYMVVHDYVNGTIRKEEARNKLECCTLPNKLQDHIKVVIDEIMSVDKKSKTDNKKGIAENNSGNNE